MDCVFCQIVDGKIPSNKVLENDKFLAFHDINPKAPVHVLIIPKNHIDNFQQSPGEMFGDMSGLSKK